jgi:glycosyltransferase involved in cell wall biosynthesis
MIDIVSATSSRKPPVSIQKFHKLLTKGLALNGCQITVLSAIPVFQDDKKIFWFYKPQVENGIMFIYPNFINIFIFRQLFVFINSFLVALIWCFKNHSHGFIISDVLSVSVSSAVRLACKLTKTPIIAIVTDLPLIQIKMHSKVKSIKDIVAMKSSNFSIIRYDGYVFLTEAMNSVLNKKGKPYVIIEGISASDLIKQNVIGKDITRNILYSGGLYEKYGIVKLVEAFKKLDFDDIRLMLFGDGELASYLLECMKEDSRICYFGMQPNNVVVKAQIRATLLVNPRSSNEEYTKYSFPSKNIEYMTSGTPMVTTALSGIPSEYYEYIYLFSDETTIGIYNTLKKLLILPNEELVSKGKAAKEFISTSKNEKIQAAKVLDLVTFLL